VSERETRRRNEERRRAEMKVKMDEKGGRSGR
jgi:hypothetical protein